MSIHHQKLNLQLLIPNPRSLSYPNFIRILEEGSHNDLIDDFFHISYDSMKWEKWMLKNTKASDMDRAIIAGHYIFSSDEFIELKNKASKRIDNLESILKNKVKDSIYRYINAFNLT